MQYSMQWGLDGGETQYSGLLWDRYTQRSLSEARDV